MKNKFIEDKNELIKQNAWILKDLDSVKNKSSLKDFHLMNIQKEIDKMDINNKNLENQNIFILKENIQLKNEIEELENKLYELKNLIRERESEFLEEKNVYKGEITRLENEIKKYKNLINLKEKEKIKIQKKYNHAVNEKKILLDKILLMQEENELFIEKIKNKNL